LHTIFFISAGGLELKTLVVYYSLEGNTKCIGDSIASSLNADVEEIKTTQPIEAGKFMDYYWTGNKEHTNDVVELLPIEKDPRKYDLIILGTPVWAWSPAPPIYSYLKKFKLRGKNMALFICSEGERGKTFQKLEKLLPGNNIISQREFINPGKDMDGSCSLKAQEWAQRIIKEAV
jgi:flavodoxin